MQSVIDPAWHNRQIELYAVEREQYAAYAAVLEKIMNAARHAYAPMGIVKVRTKTLSSFAEKVVRKFPKYNDPVHQFTDLCGAKIITQTQVEVDRMVQFIKKSFDVDEENSVDKLQALGASRFGYAAVHLIVQLPRSGEGRVMGVELPEGLVRLGLKAEVQVMTMLQHAWASIVHDSLYKNMFVPPPQWHREMNRLAATLEETDVSFARFVGRLSDYAANHGAYLPGERRRAEIDTLTLVLEKEPEEDQKSRHALRIAAIYKAFQDWRGMVEVLTPFSRGDDPRLWRELGYAMCRAIRNEPRMYDYREGVELLEKALEKDPLDAQTHACMAWALLHGGRTEEAHRAREHLSSAYELKPSDPYYLNAYLENQILSHNALEHISLMRPTILKAIDTCRAHADVKIEIPCAYFTMGRFYLLLNMVHESLSAYLNALSLCLCEQDSAHEEHLQEELNFLHRLGGKFSHIQNILSGFDSCLRLLTIAWFIKARHWAGGHAPACGCQDSPSPTLDTDTRGRHWLERARRQLQALKTADAAYRFPVVIVAGSCASAEEASIDAYRPTVLNAFRHYEGLIFSGGTESGVSGLVGSLMAPRETPEPSKPMEPTGSQPTVQTIAYLPRYMPGHVRYDPRYSRRIFTQGMDFSALESLQMWIDLLACGVDPQGVKLLGIGGGAISDFEYRLAILLGARVGLIQGSGRAADALLSEPEWFSSPRLVPLVNDPMTINAFIAEPQISIDPDKIEEMAGKAHESYRQERLKKLPDIYFQFEPSLKPWDELDPGLQHSNRHQTRYCVEILRQVGFNTEPAGEAFVDPGFTIEEVERMAEMEHGRWNVERAIEGWKYGKEKNVTQKITPYLVPWQVLDDAIREYDREAVLKWPGQLWAVGLQVVRQ